MDRAGNAALDRDTALYGRFSAKSMLGDIPIDGNAGLRAVYTDLRSGSA